MTSNAPGETGTMDVDQFMEFLEPRPDSEHWQLIEGVAVMMGPASPAHRFIAYNFCNLLNNAFAANGLDLLAYNDVGLRNIGLRNFQPEPDVAVVPGVAGYDLYSERYQLAGEILSPTNTRREIDLKLRRYVEAPDNLYAVVIEPRVFSIEIHARIRNWQPLVLTDADDAIEMPEFGLSCRVGDLYRGTPLDPQRRAGAT
jgi:Uma2 family endonuclease